MFAIARVAQFDSVLFPLRFGIVHVCDHPRSFSAPNAEFFTDDYCVMNDFDVGVSGFERRSMDIATGS
jgi:hypothetical protein